MENDIREIKKSIRKNIASVKKTYSQDWRITNSRDVLKRIESLPAFNDSKTILMYHALPDEVQTLEFITKWHKSKRIVLPVVTGNDLTLRLYDPSKLEEGHYSILEPTDTEIIEPSDIELAIIPGVAFDAKHNRLGRGRGFYDRLLPALNCELIGLGFEYQMIEDVPTEHFDRKLTAVATEKNLY